MNNAVRGLSVLGAFALAACAAVQQQRMQPVRSDQGEFKNLRILPQNITHDELIATMRGFARSLGVRCNHCHVAIPGAGPNEFDFPNDAKSEKKVARVMIQMVRNINANYIPKVAALEPEDTIHDVMCFTCHRGKVHPETTMPTPAEQPSGGRPGA